MNAFYNPTYCEKRFTQKGNLIVHEKIHGEPNHTSQVDKNSPQRTKDKNKVNYHYCGECGKQFLRKRGLRNHELMVHMGQNPHTCKHCGKGFPVNAELRKHERIHTGERPFVCQGCGESFTFSVDLKRHKESLCPEKQRDN